MPPRPVGAFRVALALLSLVPLFYPAHTQPAPHTAPVSPVTIPVAPTPDDIEPTPEQTTPLPAPISPTPGPVVLALTAVAGWRHDSIPDATALLRTHALNRRWRLTVSSNVTQYFDSMESLRVFDVVVFLLTSGDVFSHAQMTHFETFVRQGGAVVGVHSAVDTHRGWPFYQQLFGAVLAGHPPVQWATVNVSQSNHSSTEPLPSSWRLLDEIYNFVEPFGVDDKNVLMTVDETSYEGGAHGNVHPVTWTRFIVPSQARVWVTVLGHTREMYNSDELYARLFQLHIALGVEWAADGTASSRDRWREAMADLIA